MSRITVVDGVTIKNEAVAPGIGINWNPLTDTGTVVFKLATEHSIDGEFKQLLPHEPGEMSFSIDEILEYVFEVPLPDNTTMQLPGALLFLGIKSAVNTLYEARFTQPPEELPDPQPEPDPEP